MSKLNDLLQTNSIDSRRLIAVSNKLEALRPEDRAVSLARRQLKSSPEAATDAQKAKAKLKSRRGRPVSAPALQRALTGGRVTGPLRQKLVRAVNATLVLKKKSPVKSADLF